jgi:hypothetical protein
MNNTNTSPFEVITEDEFKLLMESLENYSATSEGMKIPGSIIGEIISHATEGDDIPNREMQIKKFVRTIESRREKALHEHNIRVENIRVLQGKLIGIKRKIAEESAINGVNEILKKD